MVGIVRLVTENWKWIRLMKAQCCDGIKEGRNES
jgi:hypothetical protein